MFRFLKKRLNKSSIETTESGTKVLRKTEDFRMFVIRDPKNEILGSILLTEAQHDILTSSCSKLGLQFTRK